MCVVLDDNEISFDEDESLQKRMRQLFGARPAVLDEAAAMTAVADKEATDKRFAEEAMTKRAEEERAVEEVAMKAVVAEEAAGKAADEAAGAGEGSSAPGQVPSVAEAKRAAAPPRQPNVPTGVFRNLGLSCFFTFFVGLHSLITLFA
jgi:hypothetical protein